MKAVAGGVIWVLLGALWAAQESPLSTSLLAAAAGAATGCWLAYRQSRRTLRLPRLWLLAAGLALAGALLSRVVIDLTLFSRLLGPAGAYRVSDALFWGLELLVLSALLRSSSGRRPSWLALELVLGGWVLASLTRAHEQGYISRPLALVDPLWSSGIDPLPVLIAFGILIVSVLLQLAASHTRKRGRWLDLALMTIILLSLFTLFPSHRLKDLKPEPPTVAVSGQGEEQDQDSQELDFADPVQGDSQDRPVAVVLFSDEYQPERGFYYFRQSAFSLYNGTKMVADPSGRYDHDVATEFPTNRAVEIELAPLSGGYRRPLETRVVLLEEHHQPFGLTNASGFEPQPNPDPKRFQSAYTTFSWVLDRPFEDLLELEVGDPTWDEATRQHYTDAPEDPRYAELLATILADHPQAGPLEKALVIKLWLDTHGIYSQSSGHAGADDPVADFLFGDRTGYCVFFAHAGVYLMRTAGVPARVGSGYAVASQQRGRGSALLVPASSSHAWPEIYLDGAGWVVLDVNPEQNLDPPQESQPQDLKQLLGEMARAASNEHKQSVRFDLQELAARLIGRLLGGLRWLLLAGLAGFYLVKLWRRFRPGFCRDEVLPKAAMIAMLDRLAETGLHRRTGEPRQRFAERCRVVSPTFAELTRAHLAHQMGDPEKRLPVPWRELLARAVAEWKANTAGRVRWLGALNPTSWWSVG